MVLCTGSYTVFCSIYPYTGDTYPTSMVSVSIIYWPVSVHFRLLIYGLGQSSFHPCKLQNLQAAQVRDLFAVNKQNLSSKRLQAASTVQKAVCWKWRNLDWRNQVLICLLSSINCISPLEAPREFALLSLEKHPPQIQGPVTPSLSHCQAGVLFCFSCWEQEMGFKAGCMPESTQEVGFPSHRLNCIQIQRRGFIRDTSQGVIASLVWWNFLATVLWPKQNKTHKFY